MCESCVSDPCRCDEATKELQEIEALTELEANAQDYLFHKLLKEFKDGSLLQ